MLCLCEFLPTNAFEQFGILWGTVRNHLRQNIHRHQLFKLVLMWLVPCQVLWELSGDIPHFVTPLNYWRIKKELLERRQTKNSRRQRKLCVMRGFPCLVLFISILFKRLNNNPHLFWSPLNYCSQVHIRFDVIRIVVQQIASISKYTNSGLQIDI